MHTGCNTGISGVIIKHSHKIDLTSTHTHTLQFAPTAHWSAMKNHEYISTAILEHRTTYSLTPRLLEVREAHRDISSRRWKDLRLWFWDLVSGNVSQRSRTRVRSARCILRTWGTRATRVAWEAIRPRMGCPPMRWRDGTAKSGWGPVHQRHEGERLLPGGAQHDPSEARISCMHHGRYQCGTDSTTSRQGGDGGDSTWARPSRLWLR